MPDNSLFHLQKRIKAAKQTKKITRTMELIASSRIQRGKVMLTRCQEWRTPLFRAARCLPDAYFVPLPDARSSGRKAYVVFGGSKGLSGAYSPNLLQFAKPLVDGHLVVAVGSATEIFFPDAHRSLGDEAPAASYAAAIAGCAKALWEEGEADEVHMIYMRGTKYMTEQLLPATRKEAPDDNVIVEPSARKLFPALFDMYIQGIVYEAHLQAFVAEQIARVAAMDSATRNADEIIEDLQATYNRIRQSSITQEVITVSNAKKGDG